MTFKIATVDYSTYLTKYGYQVKEIPVFSESVQTMDGVEHVAVIRYKKALTVTIRPLTATEWATFFTALSTGILSITFTGPQANTDLTANMRLDEASTDLALINTSRTLYANTTLTFTEL